MKKLIAIMLVAVMCLSVLPMMASASEVYIIAGTEALCGTAWDTANSANMMVDNLDGTFSMVYTNVPVGEHEFKVTDGTWDNAWPGENYKIEVTAVCDVTITFNPADGTVNATGANVQIPAPKSTFDSITVAGTGSLCGSDWNTGDSANAMTANGAVYTKTYTGVPAGEHKFKFAANGSWNDNWGVPSGTAVEYGVAMDAVYNSQDIVLNLSAASDVTITLDLSAYDGSSKTGAKFTVTVSGSAGGNTQQGTGGNPAPADAAYFVAGSGALCGSEWSNNDPANTMDKNADGTYSKTYPNVASGNYELKVTDGTWDKCWPGENYAFGVVSACDVTVTFNPADGSVNVTGVNVTAPIADNNGGNSGGSAGGSSAPADGTYIIAGVGALCGTDWDTTNTMNTMIKNDNGTFTFTYPDVAKGNYEFKVTDGTWDNAWPGENYAFGVSDVCDVTITFNPYDCSVTVTGDNVGAPSADNAGSDANGTIKVYAYVPDSWENPGVWAWDDNQKNAFEAWPGLAMTKGDDGWWYAEVPAWVQNVIINANNGGAQTADLDMAESADMWIPVTIVNGTVSAEIYYSEPDLGDISTPTTAPTTPPTTAPDAGADNGAEDGGSVVVTVIVSALLIIGSGVAGYFVTKAIIAKKQKAEPEAEVAETEAEPEQSEEAEQPEETTEE